MLFTIFTLISYSLVVFADVLNVTTPIENQVFTTIEIPVDYIIEKNGMWNIVNTSVSLIDSSDNTVDQYFFYNAQTFTESLVLQANEDGDYSVVIMAFGTFYNDPLNSNVTIPISIDLCNVPITTTTTIPTTTIPTITTITLTDLLFTGNALKIKSLLIKLSRKS